MRRVRTATDNFVIWHCPGCRHGHRVPTQGAFSWVWNNSVELPTLTPSVLVNKGQADPTVPVCHCFIIDGEIQFLPDCTHELAGRRVEMENVDE